MEGLGRRNYSVVMNKDTIEIETPNEKFIVKSEKRDAYYERSTFSALNATSSATTSNGIQHGSRDASQQSFNDDSQEMSGVSYDPSNTSRDYCDDSIEEDGREDEETIEREVRDVVDYMLDLIEIVVPSFPIPSRQEGADAKTIRCLDDILSSASDEGEQSDDCLEVIEEKLPFEMTVEIGAESIAESRELVRKGLCYICSSSKKAFQLLQDGRIENVCSEACLARLKSLYGQKCIQCRKHLPADSTIYHPKFGAIASNICSVKCLTKYEDLKGPKAKCRTCMKTMTTTGKSYHWQTMDFCSSKCVENVFKSVGGFCVNCKSQVNDTALGKYSVRFGDVVRQFCCVKCLEQYKRRLKSCCFCQKELVQSQKQVINVKEANGMMKTKEFCNQMCVRNYQELRAKKMQQEMCEVGEFEEAEFCSICSVYVETNNELMSIDSCKIEADGQTYFCCSDNCVAALRYQLKIKTLVCDGCSKHTWPLAGGTVLRYSGKVKIFCTKRCQSLFVLRTRKIQSCVCCRVKKYVFDLVEQYNHENGLTVLFCSLNCMNILVDTDNITEKLGKKVHHAKCATCSKIAREDVSKIFHFEDPAKGIRSFCMYQCVNQYRNNVKKIQEEARMNAELLAKHKESRQVAIAAPADRWTPNFGGPVPQSRRGRPSMQAPPTAPRHTYSTRTATGQINQSQAHIAQNQPHTIQYHPPSNIQRPNILKNSQSSLIAALNGPTRLQQSSSESQTQVIQKKTEVLLMKNPPKILLNKSVQICSSCVTKATQCRPMTREMGVQTEE